MTGSVSVAEAVAAGDRALARGAWEEARSCFDAALAHGEHPAASEGLSWALWWQEDIEACLAAREQAYRGYRTSGDPRGAARMAQWIGDDHLWYRGASAPADGWFARARRLLADLEEGPEHGWQAIFDAHVSLSAGDADLALRLAGEAQRMGRSLGLTGLEMFGVATSGLVHLEQGRITEGMRCLDEATAAALAQEYEELAPAAWTCCLMLSACEELRDDERGAQWCEQILAFSQRMGARFVVGTCRSHVGMIMARQGRWVDAEHELHAAVERLEHGPVGWFGDALARLGELHRRQGRHDDARRAFERAGERWLAQAGLAALHLDAGDVEAAVELTDRALRQLPAEDPRRAAVLEVAVRCRLAISDVEVAGEYVTQLRRIAATVATSGLQASALLSEARWAGAAGDGEVAVQRYVDAVTAFERAGATFEAAHARLELAEALTGAGRTELAREEERRARATLAASSQERPTDVRERGGAEEEARTDPLTPRQVEVLRLAAEGLTERAVAERLVLSEHTVHRHLANIYTRLGCSSRAAAVAKAGRLGLL